MGNKTIPCMAAFIDNNDELLISMTYLMRDYSEFQLPRLSDASAGKLYNAFVCLMTLYSTRLKSVGTTMSKESVEEHQSFINDSCFLLFEVMNHLSTKDFVCVEITALSSISYSGAATLDISDVLLYGLQVLLPFVQEDTLTSYPQTAERFMSFVVFIFGSYVDTVSKWFLSLAEHFPLFQHLVHLLGVGSFLPDGSTARMALQVSFEIPT